jgi:hypothetical protein
MEQGGGFPHGDWNPGNVKPFQYMERISCRMLHRYVSEASRYSKDIESRRPDSVGNRQRVVNARIHIQDDSMHQSCSFL